MMDLSTLRISKELIPTWLVEAYESHAMSLQEAVRAIIETRRSIREYSDEPVPREVIQELIEIANWAPSPENSQNWRIFAVRSPEALDRIKQLLAEAFDSKVQKLLGRAFESKPKLVTRTRGFFSTLGGAKAMLFVFATPSGHGLRIDMQSTAAWTQNFLLAAHARGLATCWFAGVLYCEDAIRDLLGVKDPDWVLATGVTLGYPAKTRLYVPRRKDHPDALQWVE